MALKQPASVVVYRGKGSNKKSRKLLIHALRTAVDLKQHSVKYITPEQIKEGSWIKTTRLIAFGGGFDLGFEAAVGKEGTKQICTFVHNGGSYLGICAGAYWACDYIEFDKGGPLEVVGERFLKFYPGLCIGPAYPGFQYHSRAGMQAVPVKYKHTTDFDTYMEGGGFFKPYNLSNRDQNISSICHTNTRPIVPASEEDQRIPSLGSNYIYPLVETLGTYSSLENKSAAIVKCNVGQGTAILSGVHVEFSAHLLNQQDLHLKPWLPNLVDSENTRMYVFKDILEQLGVKCKEYPKL